MAWTSSVLVIANRTLDSEELIEALRARNERAPASFTLLVPSTPIGSGEQGGRQAARARTSEAACERLRAAGLDVERRGRATPIR